MTDLAERRQALSDLRARYTADEGEFLFTGVQALVRVPFEQIRLDRRAGHRTAGFVSGYQGSPLGGFDRELAAQGELRAALNVVHQPGLNEELGATAVMGSQIASTLDAREFDGVIGIWYGKAPGLDRAGDAIRHAVYAGASPLGGALALVGDDPSCKSSTLPSSSELTMADLHLPTFSPGTVQEVLDFGRHAIALSRATGLWSGLKIVTAIADGTGSAIVDADRLAVVRPTLEGDRPYEPRVRPNFVWESKQIEEDIFTVRLPLAGRYGRANRGLNEVTVAPADAWLGIVAAGRTYYETMAALHRLGLDEHALAANGVRVLRLGLIHPLDPDIVRRFAAGLDEVVVVEEKRPFIESAVRDVLYGTTSAPRVVGKHAPDGSPLVRQHGALDANALGPPLTSRLTQRIDAGRLHVPESPADRALIPVIPSRTPYFCSGCPHNTGTKVPAGSVVGAGIGCHGLAPLLDPDRVGEIIGATQMGGEGSQWIGIEPFVSTDHFIQNVGDGTYFHSAALAVRAAIAARSHITFKILYNGTVAMTGGQDASGALAVPELVGTLLLEGVQRVIVTTDDTSRYRRVSLPDGADVWPRRRIVEAQEVLATVPGVTVLIHDQRCAAELRRDRKRGRVVEPTTRVVINQRVCEGCGDCGEVSNCLSVQPVETEFGRKTTIDQSSCNKDYSCLDGDCPSFLTVEPRRRLRWRSAARADRTRSARPVPHLDHAELLAPRPIVPTERFTIRIPGIGGTGVVTVSQMLATAAMLDGRFVSGLDQTGLSQKAGPVVSQLTVSIDELDDGAAAGDDHVDTLLVLDLLVGLSDQNLTNVSPERTVAVVSTSTTPTGAMVAHVGTTHPDPADLLRSLDAVTRSDDNVDLDAHALALGLFGNAATSNVLALGAAVQGGCVPLSPDAIEQAIEINGVAVETNTMAFRWGRMWVIDPSRVRASTTTSGTEPAPPSAADLDLIGDLDVGALGRTLRVRVPDLVHYQDRRLARRYVEEVRKVASAERRLGLEDLALADTVARGLYQLMAYKDEYEVARLHLLPSAEAAVANAVGEDVRVSYQLHPPILRALGMKRKIRLGPWFRPVLALLASGKRLRGTPLDPFGCTAMRRTERRLVKEHLAQVGEVVANLTVDTHDQAIELLGLVDMIRGYEGIKLANIERYRTAVLACRAALRKNSSER